MGKPDKRPMTEPDFAKVVAPLGQQLLCNTGQESNVSEFTEPRKQEYKQAQKIHLRSMQSNRLMLEYPVDSTFPTTLGQQVGRERKRKGWCQRKLLWLRPQRSSGCRLVGQVASQRQGCHRRQGGTPRPDGGSLASLYKTKVHFLSFLKV